MTTLTITPNTETKRAELHGMTAAGERVSVTIKGAAAQAWTSSALRLRVCGMDGATLAQFPLSQGDAWGVSGDDATCVLSLSTTALLAVFEARRPMPRLPFYLVLDDSAHTLYLKQRFEMEYWPLSEGSDVPEDIGGYRDVRIALSGLSDETLSDAATQRETREMVQKILAILKAAAAGSGSDPVNRRTVVYDADGNPHFMSAVRDDAGELTTIVEE